MLYNILCMGILTFGFHSIFKWMNIEEQIFEKYGVNMMRSVICGTIAQESIRNFFEIWGDKCLENSEIVLKSKNYHNFFLSYFVFDTVILIYQKYLHIEKNIRKDLFFHHIFAICILFILDNYGLYNITVLIGLSEGISFVSGLKLLSMDFGNKYITNIFIIYRLFYIIFVRICFLWIFLLYFYNDITLTCTQFQSNRNIYLLFFCVSIIVYTEIQWIKNGIKELLRI